jgi:hypothetical protein
VKVPSVLRTRSDVDALRTAIVLAMERLCFASPQAFLDDAPTGPTLDACIAFRGPTSGSVGIAIPVHAVRGFVDALLLPDARADRIELGDFVSELANIVGGNVVPWIYGRTSVHVLSPPQLARPSAPVVATAVVDFGAGWVAATLHGDA